MPEFAPGEAKLARAPITVRPAGLSCQAEVFLGPNEMTKVATSGLVSFTSTGASQDVRLPVIMPLTEASYHVYADIYAEGILIAVYQAIEDVVIGVPVPLVPCVYCGATFTTEAALVDHMEANHPGKLYLIYAYPEEHEVACGAYSSVRYKAYCPPFSSTEANAFLILIGQGTIPDPYRYGQAILHLGFGSGFCEGRKSCRLAEYGQEAYQPRCLPRGTYPLVSTGGICLNCTWVQKFWLGADTGQTITVV